MVMSAGLGTRLRPLTDVRAKPAIPVGGVPMIRRILSWLGGHGVRDVVVNLHHLPESIAAVVGDGSDLGVLVRYSWEQPIVLGAAGGPRLALPILNADTFLLTNGDVLTDVDLGALMRSHQDSGARVTLALVPNRESDRYSGVRLAPDGRVTGFAPRGEAGSYHFVGPQVVDAGVFAALPAGRPAKSIGGIYDDLIAQQPGAVRGFVSDVPYWDVGTVEDYGATSWAFEEKGSGVVSRSILWDHVEIGDGAEVEECIVTDGVRVPPGATYRRAILLRDARGGIQQVPFSIRA